MKYTINLVKLEEIPALHGGSAAAALTPCAAPMPNFFLVGAPKAGTTSLYHYLRQHPQIYMSPVKEPHFFSEEIRIENFTEGLREMAEAKRRAFEEYLAGPMSAPTLDGLVTEWPDYRKLFAGVHGETAIGEASVCYLWSKTAPVNIARHCSDARILIILRNPVERAYSNYLHMLTISDRHVSFAEHVEAALASRSTKVGALYPFLEFGLYHDQVKRYFDVFSRDRVSAYLYDDYVRDPGAFVREIFGVLQVDDGFVPDLSKKHMQARVPRSFAAKRRLKRSGMWDLAAALTPDRVRPLLKRVAFRPTKSLALSAADRERLTAIYREDIGELETLLNRDLSAWLGPPPRA